MASAIQFEVGTRRWRRVEYDRLVELGMFDGERLELLDGVLVVREPQKSYHATTVMQAGRLLEAAFGTGWHARFHAPIALDDDSEPEPDVAMVPGVPFDYVNEHPSTAPLIVEVADSSLRLDRRFKTGLYARARIPEYWIVNLVNRVLEVHRDPRPAPDAEYGVVYRLVETLHPSAIVTPVAAPSARIAVTDLLPPVS
jgi:Uma2 family endonuclease